MNKFKTTDNGGLPFVLDDNRWQDDGYRTAFKGIMSAFGIQGYQAVILSGCERSANSGIITIAEGYVSISGEICHVPTHSYPLSAPNDSEYWTIAVGYSNPGNKNFQDAGNHDTYEIREGKIETASSIPTGFTAYENTPSIYQLINERVDSVPLGAILMWSGNIVSVPSGYALCDGENNTPDLRGRFVVGRDPRTTNPVNGIWDPNYNTIGNTGGEKDHALTLSEMPPHQHDMIIANSTGSVNDPTAIIIPSATEGNHDYDPPDVSGSTGSKGSGAKHNNVPPYYVVAFIIKVATSISSAPGGQSGASTGSQSN